MFDMGVILIVNEKDTLCQLTEKVCIFITNFQYIRVIYNARQSDGSGRTG